VPLADIGQPYSTGKFLPLEFYGATGNAQATVQGAGLF
jgi:hypothetical protein